MLPCVYSLINHLKAWKNVSYWLLTQRRVQQLLCAFVSDMNIYGSSIWNTCVCVCEGLLLVSLITATLSKSVLTCSQCSYINKWFTHTHTLSHTVLIFGNLSPAMPHVFFHYKSCLRLLFLDCGADRSVFLQISAV